MAPQKVPVDPVTLALMNELKGYKKNKKLTSEKVAITGHPLPRGVGPNMKSSTPKVSLNKPTPGKPFDPAAMSPVAREKGVQTVKTIDKTVGVTKGQFKPNKKTYEGDVSATPPPKP